MHLISHFKKLANQFLAHFTMSRAHKKTKASLINIKQGKDEPLISYLAIFNQVTLEIKDLTPTIVMHVILVRLRSNDFFKSLTKKPIKTMIKLLAR